MTEAKRWHSGPGLSRRRFLGMSAGWAALAAGLPRLDAATPGGERPLRIHSVDCYPVRLWAATPPGIAEFDSDHDPRRWHAAGPFGQLVGATVVVVRTDAGATGFGLGCGGAVAKTIVERHLRPLLVGADAGNVELLWEQLYSSARSYGRRGVFVMALSGVDNALWDIAGKAAGQPVWKLLGGEEKRVPAYYTGRAVERGLEHGFASFKWVVRDGPADGSSGKARIERELGELRRRIGDERRLMIDCGMRWDDVAYTLEMMERLRDLDLYFIEEPLSPDDVLGYAELVRRLSESRQSGEGARPLIASGEHEYTHHGFEMLFHHRAIEVVQPDVSWCGGVTSLRRIAAMAAEQGLPFIPHRGGSLYGMPLVVSSPDAPICEAFGTADPATDLMLAMTSPYDKGHYLTASGPGFGTAVSEDLVRRHLAPD